MLPTKKNTKDFSSVPLPPPTDTDFLIEQENYDKYVEENFNEKIVGKIRRFCYLLSEIGLPFDEACYHIRYKPEEFKKLIKLYPPLEELIVSKQLEFKKSLMHVAVNAAKLGDVKIAMWLLEKRFPDEFNMRKNSGTPPDSLDEVGQILELIQRETEPSGLITEKKMTIKSTQQDNREIIEQINSILN